MRVFLGHLPRDLDWQGVERAMEESCGVEGKEQVYKALNGQLFNMDLDLQREVKRLITLLTDKVNTRSIIFLFLTNQFVELFERIRTSIYFEVCTFMNICD